MQAVNAVYLKENQTTKTRQKTSYRKAWVIFNLQVCSEKLTLQMALRASVLVPANLFKD